MDVIDTRQNVRLAILLEMLEDVSRAVDPEEAVHAYAARIGKLRPVDAVLNVSVRNLPAGEYKITRKVTPQPGGADPDHHIANPWRNWNALPSHAGGFIGEVLKSPEPRLIHELFLRSDPVLGDELGEMGSCLAIPVFDGGRVLNWTLQFRRDPHGFTMDELEQNVLTGNLFGAMTKNLVSLEQINRLNEKLRQQFEEVARVQQALLPRRLPAVPGLRIATSYLPSEQAGGDYFSFFELSGGRLGSIIADVSGHGPAAATVMAMLHAMIHAYPGDRETATPADVIRFANRQLCSSGMEGAFATAVVSIYHPDTRDLVYASAGHPPPRLLDHAGGESAVRMLDGEASLPMGIMDEMEVPLTRIRLSPRQSLVLFTDGITEAFNDEREMFGYEGLDVALHRAASSESPEIVIDAIHAAVYRHTNRRSRDDDQTLVVLSVSE